MLQNRILSWGCSPGIPKREPSFRSSGMLTKSLFLNNHVSLARLHPALCSEYAMKFDSPKNLINQTHRPSVEFMQHFSEHTKIEPESWTDWSQRHLFSGRHAPEAKAKDQPVKWKVKQRIRYFPNSYCVSLRIRWSQTTCDMFPVFFPIDARSYIQAMSMGSRNSPNICLQFRPVSDTNRIKL